VYHSRRKKGTGFTGSLQLMSFCLASFTVGQEIQMLENHKMTVRDRIEEIDRKIAALIRVKEQ
jgi:hypothetical protein